MHYKIEQEFVRLKIEKVSSRKAREIKREGRRVKRKKSKGKEITKNKNKRD